MSKSKATHSHARSNPESPEPNLIVDVWEHNFLTELRKISSLASDYPIISFDTEFPGIVDEAGDEIPSNTYFSYDIVKGSVEKTSVIQVGVTLSDEKGRMPPETCTWQFHLRYDLLKEHYAHSSIGLLQEAGINLDTHKKSGIPLADFAEHLTTSGLVLCEGIKWVCFHGIFDFAYLLKLLTGERTLPDDEYQFQDTLKLYFPCYMDVKAMAAPWTHLQGSLAKLCQELDIKRIGIQHQAGSDSLVTAAAYFKLRDQFYSGKSGKTSIKEMANVLYGLDPECDRWSYPAMPGYYPPGVYSYQYVNPRLDYNLDRIIKNPKGKAARSASEEGKEHVAPVGAN